MDKEEQIKEFDEKLAQVAEMEKECANLGISFRTKEGERIENSSELMEHLHGILTTVQELNAGEIEIIEVPPAK